MDAVSKNCLKKNFPSKAISQKIYEALEIAANQAIGLQPGKNTGIVQ